MPTSSSTPLYLSIFGCSILIECADTEALGLLTASFGHMATSQPFGVTDLTYAVGLNNSESGFYISTSKKELLHAADSGEFMFLIEKELTIELERLRANLFFCMQLQWVTKIRPLYWWRLPGQENPLPHGHYSITVLLISVMNWRLSILIR